MADIILENKHFCLTLGEDGIAKSLIHKASGEECLDQTERMCMFSLTEPRPYNNEIKLADANVIPVSHRRYVSTTMSREEIVEAFTKAELI